MQMIANIESFEYDLFSKSFKKVFLDAALQSSSVVSSFSSNWNKKQLLNKILFLCIYSLRLIIIMVGPEGCLQATIHGFYTTSIWDVWGKIRTHKLNLSGLDHKHSVRKLCSITSYVWLSQLLSEIIKPKCTDCSKVWWEMSVVMQRNFLNQFGTEIRNVQV